MGELVPDFFSFYACEFDWMREVVSPRLGRRSLKASMQGVDCSYSSCLPSLVVEDPVEPDVDLASPYLDSARARRLRAEFRRASRLLCFSLDASNTLSSSAP